MTTHRFTFKQIDQIVQHHIFPEGALPITILAQGPLGAGKTTLAQVIARFLGIKELVNSPTFNYVNVYELPVAIGLADRQVQYFVHFDLYRVTGVDELYGLGLLELLNKEKAVVFVEWPEILLQNEILISTNKKILNIVLKHVVGPQPMREIQINVAKN